MTRVDFYVLPDDTAPQRFACTMAGKARQQGYRVHIHTESRDDAQDLDDLLWTFRDISFLPHCLQDDAESADSPITLGWEEHCPDGAQVLINLAGAVPGMVDRFERVVETVPDSRRESARDRYRRYRDLGFELHSHEIGHGEH